MSHEKNSDSQDQQLNHDRDMKAYDRLHDLIGQGAKGLSLLNGGAVVAMLAFVQALVDKPVYCCFKPYALGALSFFLLGTFFSFITWPSVMSSKIRILIVGKLGTGLYG